MRTVGIFGVGFTAIAAAAGAGGGVPANSLFIDGSPVLVDGFSIVFA